MLSCVKLRVIVHHNCRFRTVLHARVTSMCWLAPTLTLKCSKHPKYDHITSHHITSHHIASHHIASHHITSHHITSQHHISSHHIISHRIISHHIISHRITSHHITSHDMQSHHIAQPRTCVGKFSPMSGGRVLQLVYVPLCDGILTIEDESKVIHLHQYCISIGINVTCDRCDWQFCTSTGVTPCLGLAP